MFTQPYATRIKFLSAFVPEFFVEGRGWFLLVHAAFSDRIKIHCTVNSKLETL